MTENLKKVLILFLALTFIVSYFVVQHENNDFYPAEKVNAAPPDWWNVSWLYRKKITINESQITGSSALTNFPVLVSLASDANLSANAQADADDIAFASSDGATKYDHEIVRYTSGTGLLIAWVRIPSLSATANTDIYMYYGNGSASSQQNKTGVWDSNYRGVWHLEESGDGVADEFKDSTSNVNHGKGRFAGQTPDQITAKVGYGQNFIRANFDGILVDDDNTLDITGDITLSAWVYRNANSSIYQQLITKRANGGSPQYQLNLNAGGSNYVSFQGTSYKTGTTALGVTVWDQVAIVVNSSASTVEIYKNGAYQETLTSTAPGANNTAPLYFAQLDAGEALNGAMDEIRVLATQKSADWLGAEYNNQNAPGTFYTLDSHETQGSSYTQFNYRFFANANSTNVGSALAAQNTGATLAAAATQFRLRLILNVTGADLAIGGQAFKLQFATRSGTCDTAFSGETYADVSTSSGVIRYRNNTTPADGAALTANANDPTGTGTVVNQTYEEANNFTTTTAITAGNSGKWDFALVPSSAPANTSYCFRVVKSDGSLLDSYSFIPQITTYAGVLTVDIVNGSGTPIGSPSYSLAGQTTSFTCLTSTGTMGISTSKIRVTNSTVNANWTLSLAATSGATAVWTTGTYTFDYNDSTTSGCGDGGDTDAKAGQLTVDPSGGTITPQSGCASTGISKGNSTAYVEGSANSVTLLAASGADVNCYWDFITISLSQKIPAEQLPGTYALPMTLTVVAN